MRRLFIINPHSRYCKELGIEEGIFASVGDVDDARSLGRLIIATPISWTPKAVNCENEPRVAVYDKDDDRFRQIVDKSNSRNAFCSYGVEFILQVGSEPMTFYCGTKTFRRACGPIAEALDRSIVLSTSQLSISRDTGLSLRWFTFHVWYPSGDSTLNPRYVPDDCDDDYDDPYEEYP